MSSSDDEAVDVPVFVSDYHFEDEDGDPISFSTLPIRWSNNVTTEGKKKKLFIRGKAEDGLQLIFEPVTAWKCDLSGAEPDITVLWKRNKWVKLQKPRKSYESLIRSVLITVRCFHIVRNDPETSGKLLWDQLYKAFRQYEVRPSENDLIDQMQLIEEAIKVDTFLAKSKFLTSFLEERPKKKKVVIEDAPAFVVDETYDECMPDDDDDEDDEDYFAVCAICDNGGNITTCDGICMRSFHATPEDAAASDDENYIDIPCQTLGLSKSEIDATPPFYCKNCRHKLHQCFACGKLGSSDKDSGAAEVFQCSSATCGFFYHPDCVAKLLHPEIVASEEEIRKIIASGGPFTCPCHRCYVCKQMEDATNRDLQFAVCRRCPRSYHRKCLPRRIIYESTEEEDQRAWEGLLPNSRILIYCLKHRIVPELGTPLRSHLKFPDDGEKKKVPSMQLPSKDTTTVKKKKLVPRAAQIERIPSKSDRLVLKSPRADGGSERKEQKLGTVSVKKPQTRDDSKGTVVRRKPVTKKAERASSDEEGKPSPGEKLYAHYLNKSDSPVPSDPEPVKKRKTNHNQPESSSYVLDADSVARMFRRGSTSYGTGPPRHLPLRIQSPPDNLPLPDNLPPPPAESSKRKRGHVSERAKAAEKALAKKELAKAKKNLARKEKRKNNKAKKQHHAEAAPQHDVASSAEFTSHALVLADTQDRSSFHHRREHDEPGPSASSSSSSSHRGEPAVEVGDWTPRIWLLAPADLPIPGGPLEPFDIIIPSIGGHIAIDLWRGLERQIQTFITRGFAIEKLLKLEMDQMSLDVIKESGFHHMAYVCHKWFNLSLISAFVERWQPDTNTFHLSCGEMTITLHDVWHILHIPIVGEAVHYEPPLDFWKADAKESLPTDLALKFVREGLLVSPKTMRQKKSYSKEGIPYSRVREWMKDKDYKVQARGYLYHLAGATLFPDKENDRIRPATFWPVHDLDKVSGYAWGAATLAYLYRQLGISSRAETKTLAGCLTLLQIWIYDHFPDMHRTTQTSSVWDPTKPRASFYTPIEASNVADKDSLRNYRAYLDRLTPQKVNWTPYGRDAWKVHDCQSTFIGHIHYVDIAEMYMPDRCLRQFGLVQDIPMNPTICRNAVRSRNATVYKVSWGQTTDMWKRHVGCNPYFVRHHDAREDEPWRTVDGYLDWFLSRTHPLIISNVTPGLALDDPRELTRELVELAEPYFADMGSHGFPTFMEVEDRVVYEQTMINILKRLETFDSAMKAAEQRRREAAKEARASTSQPKMGAERSSTSRGSTGGSRTSKGKDSGAS